MKTSGRRSLELE